jgi:molybdopterin-synthase adenylyltransferase
MLSDLALERYARQLLLPDWDLEGQARVAAARVLLVGAGGLGCAAGLYLAAAGVGELCVADGDTVELSNLQRQVAFTMTDVGRNKAEALAARLAALNPEVRCRPVTRALDLALLQQMLPAFDLVVEATDSDASRRAVNSACVRQRVPWISAAAQRYEGRLIAFDPRGAGPCFACLQPEPPTVPEGCATLGVLGPLVGVVGSLLAARALRQLVAPSSVVADLTLIDLAGGDWQVVQVPRRAACPVCGPDAGTRASRPAL